MPSLPPRSMRVPYLPVVDPQALLLLRRARRAVKPHVTSPRADRVAGRLQDALEDGFWLRGCQVRRLHKVLEFGGVTPLHVFATDVLERQAATLFLRNDGDAGEEHQVPGPVPSIRDVPQQNHRYPGRKREAQQ